MLFSRKLKTDQYEHISVELNGGLGNQLFQYALGRSQASRLGVPLILDVSKLGVPGMRNFELSSFDNSLQLIQGRPKYLQPYIEKSFKYEAEVNLTSKNTHFRGFFQSWKYFESIEKELKNSFIANELPKTSSQQDFIALQVRRGDYLNPEQLRFHGICTLDYYKSGLSKIRSLTGNLPALIFCDDQPTAELFAKELPNSYPDIPSVDESPLETMKRLSKASGHVIANSSFGWWGSWFSESSLSTIAPRPWFGDRTIDTYDLLPPHWLTLDREPGKLA